MTTDERRRSIYRCACHVIIIFLRHALIVHRSLLLQGFISVVSWWQSAIFGGHLQGQYVAVLVMVWWYWLWCCGGGGGGGGVCCWGGRKASASVAPLYHCGYHWIRNPYFGDSAKVPEGDRFEFWLFMQIHTCSIYHHLLKLMKLFRPRAIQALEMFDSGHSML